MEDASAGTQLAQELKESTRLPILPVKATLSKITRVDSITRMLESGTVLFPENAPRLPEFLRECLSFPGGRRDHGQAVGRVDPRKTVAPLT
jgi:predicted phage terminase large subunit-like protein